jgi:uncharacterized peroxidase-related enzyme
MTAAATRQRIPALAIDKAPADAQPILQNIRAKFGKVPNIFASVANSPAALKTLMGMFGALEQGALNGKPHEALALRVGEMHGCRYCTAAHTAKAKMAGATEAETIAFRKGQAQDPKLQALLDLVTAMVEKRGQVGDALVAAARKAGATDAELLEAVAIVSLNTFTNYINALVQTEVDFPKAPPLA